jgi:hypothetical protein
MLCIWPPFRLRNDALYTAVWVRGSSLYCESEMYGIGGLMNNGMNLHGAQQGPAFLIGCFWFKLARDAEESIITEVAEGLAEMLPFNQPFPQASS